MSAHTPGPWFVSLGSIAGVTETHTVVLTGRDAVGVFARNDKTRKANARLIAAAPELLAALEEMLATHPAAYRSARSIDNREDAAVALARAAIVKARGGK